MNIIKSLTARIDKALLESKNPCKSYKTEEMAEKKTLETAMRASRELTNPVNGEFVPAHYVVFYHEGMGRWVGAINLTELVTRPNKTGGYLGVCIGWFTW